MSYHSLMLSTSPIAYLRCNGNVNDSSTNGNNGTPSNITYGGGAIRTDPGGSAVFNNSSIVLPNGVTFSTGFTINFWMNLPNLTHGGMRVADSDHTDVTNDGYQLVINGSGGGFCNVGLGSGQQDIYFSYAWITGTWYHIAFTYGSTVGLAMYVNGVQIATNLGSFGSIAPSSHPSTLGLDAQNQQDQFYGSLAEVAYHVAPLPSGQIQTFYNAGIANFTPIPINLSFVEKQLYLMSFH